MLRQIRGPRLGTKLMLLGLLLFILPWFSYRQLVEMERLLIQGQSHAQLLTAEGISTLFNGREDLFNDLPVTIEDYESLFAHPLQNNIRLDGRVEDWGDELTDKYLTFGMEAGSSTGTDGSMEDGAFQLLLGERGGQLYVHMRVTDSNVVYRDPDYLRLDNADHVRLSFIRADGEDGRIGLVFPAPGVVTAYQMDADWRFAATGTPDNSIQGYVEPTDDGWVMEFRLPLEQLGSRRYFGLAVADVDDANERSIVNLVQTLPTAGKESFNLVVLRSPEVLNIIQGLGYSGARILVIDSQKRVRAETGTHITTIPSEPRNTFFGFIRDGFEYVRPLLHRVSMLEAWEPARSVPDNSDATADATISASLNGEPIALRRSLDEYVEIIMAAHPIVSRDAVIGTVVVEQNIDEILSFQRSALEQVILLSITSVFAVFIALLAFSVRLAWRIRNLRREASAAIDQYGRLKTNTLKNEIHAGDEIGDLARSVSNMLSKLHQHNHFLENMPRTLRHEINNPLNTLSTSLQNLAEENPEVRDSKYLDSAKRGVIRIGSIVQNLADAANLEESLEAEDLEVVDIQQLLENYVSNCRVSHDECEFVYRGTNHPVFAEVSDYRIEQLLDKILDNAIDFHRTNSPIKVQLDAYRDYLQITVANRGPILPDKSEKSLFDSMVSHRGPQNRLHFGLGLYVVRIIAEYHGGTVQAVNLTDGSGVAIVVQLPIAEDVPDALRVAANGEERSWAS
ncbi:MAG: ATP-binding protein [Gammaproteobacteria bacterium]|nr:ATP-binding protein [Gammaproteobacteria bacterium]